MVQPVIVWSLVVGALLVAFIVRLVRWIYSVNYSRDCARSRHLLEFSRERDLFYGPWESTDEEDDFEDL